MSLEKSVCDASSALRSDRVAERRRNAGTLKDLLEPASAQLSTNQSRGSGFSWDSVFENIHEFVLKECDKFETNRTFGNIQALCANLLHTTVHSANKGKAYIKWELVLDSILHILRNQRLTKAMGDIYVNLLHKHIMPCEHYLRHFTPQTWEDLISTCVSLSCREQSNVDSLTILRLILQLLQNGAVYCHFVIATRDVIPKLRKHYSQANHENKIQEVLLSIGVQLLEILSHESRLTMCEFTESVIPVLLKFYEQNTDQKKKSLLFHFLGLTIQLHHPHGRLKSEKGSLAHNWNVWDKQLLSILDLVKVEGEFLEQSLSDTKFKFHSDTGKYSLCEHYVKLSAVVTYQVIHTDCHNTHLEEYEESPAKRPRYSNIKTFSDLICKLRENPVPWISVISAYIRLYSETISRTELAIVLGVMDNYVSSTNSKIDWNDFKSTTCSILEKLSPHIEDTVDSIVNTLFSSCVRYSSVDTAAHSAIHGTMQAMIQLNLVNKKHLPQLLKLYNESAMPVTVDSVTTLNHLFRVYENIFGEKPLKCLTWLNQMKLNSSNLQVFGELLFNLITKESLQPVTKNIENAKDILFSVAFEDSESNILASEFEIVLWKESKLMDVEQINDVTLQTCSHMKDEIDKYLCTNLNLHIDKFKKDKIVSLDVVHYLQISLYYFNNLLRYNICGMPSLEDDDLWNVTCRGIDTVFGKIGQGAEAMEASEKYQMISALSSLLCIEHNNFIERRLRTGADEAFFRVLHEIINQEDENTSQGTIDDVFDVDDPVEDLRGIAIEFCAYYCKKEAQYREDILEMILDPKLYNFSSDTDTKTAFQCIEILTDRTVKEKPIESLFRLMQSMCKPLFRNTHSSTRLLKMLHSILDDIGSQPIDTMKDNCIIMLKGYLRRCETSYYAPCVTALVYKCIARIIELKHQKWVNIPSDSMVKGLESSVHSLRLYTCYILNNLFERMNDNDLKTFLIDFKIFEVQVSTENEEVLRDEAANRTSTVLHCISALTLVRPMWMTKLIAALLEIAKVKAIDKALVKKVLDLVVSKLTDKPSQEYIQSNLLSLMYYWCNMKIDITDISFYYFGYDSIDEFFQKHMSWLIPAEVLWLKKGDLASSALLALLRNKLKIEEDSIINNCFCNMLALSLPHFVHDKYKVSSERSELSESGVRMFHATIEWVGGERLSTLCGQHFSSLILLTTKLLLDPQHLMKEYNCRGPMTTPESHNYSIITYDMILKYFGEMVGGCILQDLCGSQPLAISKVLLHLWSQIEAENILEAKLVSIYRYVVFFERIPLNTPLDSFVCHFVCNSLLNTLRACHKDVRKNHSVGAVCRAIHKVLLKILPDKLYTIEKCIPDIMSFLIVIKQETNCNEAEELLSFLLNDMEYCLKDSIDMVDGALALTQGRIESQHSSWNFLESLKNLIAKLTDHSVDTIKNVNTFIRTHRTDLLAQCKNLKDIKGFSEDCRNSILHQLINSLTEIVAKSEDKLCILAACDCLALLGPSDLKTLVMSTPESQDAVVCVNPSQHMAVITLNALSENVFDENPKVINKTMRALKCLLSYREGKFAMEQNVQNDKFHPFIAKRKNHGAVRSGINDDSFDTMFNNPHLWIPSENEKHEEWLIKVVTSLINVFYHENTYYSELQDVCTLKPSLAEKLIPPFVGLMVSCATENQLQALSALLTTFFQHFYEETFYSTQNSNGLLKKQNSHSIMDRHKSSVETMLQTVDFVRLQRLQYKRRRDQVEKYNYLDVNYHPVAWAACMTGHSMAAVMYAELWCMAQNDGIPPNSPEATAGLPNGENIQSMFRKSYVAIGEFDSVYGCGTGHLSSESEKVNHILRLGHFSDALLMHDIALSRTSVPDQNTRPDVLHRGVIRSMHKSGLYHLAVQYMKCLPDDSDLDDVKYECFSKLGDWSLMVDKSSLNVTNDSSFPKLETAIKASQYSCLKDCLNIPSTDGYENRLHIPLENAKLCISKFLRKSNIENCQVIYNATSHLQVLQEIEDYYDLRCKKRPMLELLTEWDVENLMPFDDFKHIEPVLSQRSLILEHAVKFDASVVNEVIDLQLKYAELAMVNDRQQMSSRLVALARKVQPGGKVSLMDGRVFWANGHKDVALHLIKSVIQDHECTDRILRANALWQYGTWMMELRNESGRDILDKYLKRSLDTLGEGGHMETQLKVYLDLAKFADAEYKQVVSYIKSSVFENKVKCMENMKGTASSIKLLQSQQTITSDERRALFTNEKLSKLEEAEITSTLNEKKRFLDLAVKYYLLSLSHGELSDLSIFRVISLWIDNPTLEFDDSEDSLQQLLAAVPSTKYLTVLPQVTPRLTMDNSSFASSLNNIIERCAVDHPHHTLPLLLALSNSHKDQTILNASGKGTSQRPGHVEPRITAAKNMIQKLSETDEALQVMISQMDQMYNALISLAYYTAVKAAKDKPNKKHSIPRAEPLIKLKNLNSTLVPIVNLPVKKDCLYTDITSVVSFSNEFSLVGGINAPKKMLCRCSDGIERTILLKGEDDLRQDAVMQQVFTIVNSFLEMNRETSRHKLIIRTYKVVPLSRRSGVLEWCEGTDTMGNFLVGAGGAGGVAGAHQRYRPKDISASAARSMLAACSDKGKSKQQKVSVFMNILSQFKPVFHHFFTENFLAPVTWYERRLAYTKSVATSSMVGYMLGLGDRHVQNLLVDKKTAEIIHIDFGIAFDQGRALPTPETVPFRLTQDIVAGFGSCGVEGVFRRSCEKTLQLLRDNQETLLTILEVLLCDPLYTWTITAEELKRKQNIPTTPRDVTLPGMMADSGGGNAGGGPAERALLAVRSKLCGTEGSAGGGVAVPGLVARLLQHAADPANLAQLYPGWQQYL